MLSLTDLETKLFLARLFKEKPPATFRHAFELALTSGIKNITMKNIAEALEIYAAGKGERG